MQVKLVKLCDAVRLSKNSAPCVGLQAGPEILAQFSESPPPLKYFRFSLVSSSVNYYTVDFTYLEVGISSIEHTGVLHFFKASCTLSGNIMVT